MSSRIRSTWKQVRQRLVRHPRATAALLLALVVGGGAGLAGLAPLPPVARPPLEVVFSEEPTVRVRLAELPAGEQLRLTLGSYRVTVGRESVRLSMARPWRWTGQDLEDGESQIFTLPLRIQKENDEPIPFDGHLYLGSLELVSRGGLLFVVNHVPMETYLEGVLEAEMGGRFHDAALAAQAVASRSYAANAIQTSRDAIFDVTNDQFSQVYRGLPRRRDRFRSAVGRTRGLVLAHGGKVLPGIFMSCCGGNTRPAGEAFGGPTPPPLAGTVCTFCSGATVATWKARCSARALASTLRLASPPSEVLDLRQSESGRLIEVTLRVGANTKSLSVKELRRAFGPLARSTWFTSLEFEGDTMVATGRGFGHGVGLCQHGTEAQARHHGRSPESILTHYFPGAVLASLWLTESP